MLESNVFLRYILGFWVQVVPVAALCYLAFDPEDYRLSVKKTAFLNLGVMLLLSILETFLWVWNEQLQGTDYEAAFSGNSTIFYGFLLLCFFLFLACVRSTLVKKLLVFSMGFAYAVFVASGANTYLTVFPESSFWDASREAGVMLQGGLHLCDYRAGVCDTAAHDTVHAKNRPAGTAGSGYQDKPLFLPGHHYYAHAVLRELYPHHL